MKKKILFVLLPLLIIIAGFVGAGYYIYNNILDSNTIYSGIKVENVSLSDMTKEQALNYLKVKKENEHINKSMKLTYEDFDFHISLEDLGFAYDYQKAIDAAYDLGREGNYIDRFMKIQSLKKNGEVLGLESNIELSKIKPIVEDIAQKVNLESKNAVFDFNGGNFKVTEDRVGRAVDENVLAKLIEDNIDKFNNIDLPVNIINPQYNKAFYSSINGIIGEYSTSFKGSGLGRIENIKLSAKALSNKLILPGEQLSYNETTGPRQSKFGYQEAPVIIAGDLTPGIGGGVCQTSTTLYNALLLADMKILQRSPHSIAPAYVPKGQDAAVATGYLDLVFKNEFDFPVYTFSKVVGDRVYFYIYGDTTKKDYIVKIDPELLEKIDYGITETPDNTIPAGTKSLIQDGRTGYKVKTYKTIIKDGKVINKTPITSDYYRERNYIYKVGPGPISDAGETTTPIPGVEDSEETISLDADVE